MGLRRRRALAEDGLDGSWLRGARTGEISESERESLVSFLSPERARRLDEVLAARSDRLLLVLDNLFDPHNLSAILRTADAVGLQHVLLTGSVPAGVNPQIARGAQRWLTIRREPEAHLAVEALRASGFTIAATTLSPAATGLDAFEPAGPVALVLGNEHEGLGAFWLENADVQLKIPLTGFAQSLNVSVAAGIFLHALLQKPALSRRGLPQEEARALSFSWVVKSVPHARQILKRLHGEGPARREA